MTMQKKMNEEQDNFFMNSKAGWFFIPSAFKIYIDVSPDVGAKRIFFKNKSLIRGMKQLLILFLTK